MGCKGSQVRFLSPRPDFVIFLFSLYARGCVIIMNMRVRVVFYAFIAIITCPGRLGADVIDTAGATFDIARGVCGGIADQISSVSGISRVNTVVSAAGAALGGGALDAGIKKNSVDSEINRIEQQICNAGGCDADRVAAMTDSEFFDAVMMPMGEIARLQQLRDQSRNLGNWRTGLLAGAGATHIASAIISGINVNQSDLAQHITACNRAIMELKSVRDEMSAAGVNPYEHPIRMSIDNAINNCVAIDVTDVEKIEKREKWVLGASVVGGTAAIVGTVTSAASNSDAVRNDDTNAGKRKEQNLNTTSNVLAGVSTVGSGVSVGFNISLVTLTNRMMRMAQNCEDAFIAK